MTLAYLVFNAANKNFMSRCPRSLRNRFLASLNAPATQRSVICPSFQRLTLRVKWAIEPLRFSIGLVVRSVRFIGDEIEAVFGAPIQDARHADAAVAAAREMGKRLDTWNSARSAAGKAALRRGIGIHTGTVIAGNIGSSE